MALQPASYIGSIFDSLWFDLTRAKQYRLMMTAQNAPEGEVRGLGGRWLCDLDNGPLYSPFHTPVSFWFDLTTPMLILMQENFRASEGN